MALLLNEIAWAEPVLPSAPDAAWEAELKRRGAQVFEVDRRIAPSPWLREAAYGVISYLPSELPERLFRIGSMITAQENSCRYCYGATRAYMKVLGYSETFIQRIERDVQVAELNDKDRAFIAFCRNLARSRPRPAAAAREALLGVGFAPAQVNEMAFAISQGCFYNRVSTLIACPPEQKFERMADGPVGRLIGLVTPFLQKFARRKPAAATLNATALAGGHFGVVLAPLAGLPAAKVMKSALDGAFESQVLSRSTKALMFAVIARTLGCRHCEAESRKLLLDEGLSHAEIDTALATLRCPQLASNEARLLAWARDTVYYEPSSIQQKTRALAPELNDAAVLEAIGVAALANGTVRMAMLLE